MSSKSVSRMALSHCQWQTVPNRGEKGWGDVGVWGVVRVEKLEGGEGMGWGRVWE